MGTRRRRPRLSTDPGKNADFVLKRLHFVSKRLRFVLKMFDFALTRHVAGQSEVDVVERCFRHYNYNGNDRLDIDEVREIMLACSFEVDQA